MRGSLRYTQHTKGRESSIGPSAFSDIRDTTQSIENISKIRKPGDTKTSIDDCSVFGAEQLYFPESSLITLLMIILECVFGPSRSHRKKMVIALHFGPLNTHYFFPTLAQNNFLCKSKCCLQSLYKIRIKVSRV